MTATIEGADVAVDTATPPADPSTLEKLARNLIGTAQLVDDAIAAMHDRLNAMLEAAHGTIQYLVAENADLKFRLESLEK